MVLLGLRAVSAAEPDSGSMWNFRIAESAFAFACDLESRGEYYRAITEYQRFLFLCPDDSRASLARFFESRCYLKGGRLEEAVGKFNTCLLAAEDPCLINAARYGISQASFLLGDYQMARAHLTLLKPDSSSKLNSFDVYYPQIISHLRELDFQSAQDLIGRASDGGSASWVREMQPIVDKMERRPVKSPLKAGILSSVIPGLGQAYSGRFRDAITAFLVNGVFIGAIAYSIDAGHDETALVLAFFETGWYSANIYNAVNDAHKKNRSILETHLQMLDKQFGKPYRHSEEMFPCLDPK